MSLMSGSTRRGVAMYYMSRRRRARKILRRIVALMFFAVIAGGLVITHVEISSPRLKNVVASKLSDTLGLSVTMEALSVKLSRGLRIENLSLGEGGSEVFSAKELVFHCNLFRMMRRQFNVRSIVIDQPVFTLREGGVAFVLPVGVPEEETSSKDSDFEFQLAKAKIQNGKVNIIRDGAGSDEMSLTINEINLDISSEGKGKPVKIEGGGKVAEALGFSLTGFYQVGGKVPINLEIIADVDWSEVGEMFSKFNIEPLAQLKGVGKTTLTVNLSGEPDQLSIDVKGDLTENEILYGELFHKPSGVSTKLMVASTYSPERLEFTDIRLTLGESLVALKGFYEPEGKNLSVTVSSEEMDIAALAKCLIPLKDTDTGGKARLNFELHKEADEVFEVDGRIEVKDWKYDYFSGEHLSCDIKNKGEQIMVDDILIVVGEGKITGSGVIEPDGKYRFSIKGENIDMKKFLSIKKEDEMALDMDGKARLSAQIVNKGGGVEGLNGKGHLEIKDGTIKSFSWLEGLFAMINLPELMPFKYDTITGGFNIKDGKVVLNNATVQAKDAVFNVEEGNIDLVGKTKNVSADLALAPHLVERERSKFKEFDKFFYIDDNGYAHLSIVWTGPLSKGTPDLTASIVKTGVKKYGRSLLEKIFGRGEEE